MTLSFESKETLGAYCPVGQAEANVEEEEREDDGEENVPVIPVVEPRKSRRKTSKPDLKGKDIAFSPEK